MKLFLILFNFLLLIIQTNCKKNSQKIDSSQEIQNKSQNELTFKNMTLSEYANGQFSFKAHIHQAEGNRENLHLNKINLIHRGMGLTGKFEIKADEGNIFVAEEGIEFKKGFILKDSYQRTLSVSYAHYQPAQKLLKMSGPISITGDHLVLHASEIVGYLDKEEFIMKGPITGTFVPL